MSTFYLKLLDYDLYLIKILNNNYKINFYELINLVLIKNKFCSFTKSEKEVSLIIDKESYELNKFKKGYIKLNIKYKALQFYEEGSGVQHIGIVNKISSIFTTHKIPILYINTFNNNYVIIEDKDLDKVIQILKINDFNIIE